MHHLSNKLLIETYEKALELELGDSFLEIINDEINTRKFTKEELFLMRRVSADR